MASPHHATVTFLALALLLTQAIAAAKDSTTNGGAMTHLHFYFHELFSGGPNGTSAAVAPAARNGSSFGAVYVVDDMLRDGADPASRLLGRVQGLTAAASMADGALLTMLNFVFTDGPHNGSTLAVFGRALLGTVMERAVVGGTGEFRMARGYTLSTMVQSPDPNNLLVLEYDAYIWH